MGKNLVFKQIANVLIAAHSSNDPSDEEWEAFKRFSMELPAEVDRYVIATDGGGPSAKQRAAVNEVVKWRAQPRVVIISSSTLVRGPVSALSWFNPRIRAFAPPEFHEAMKYLELTPTQSGQVGVELRKLQAELKR